MQKINHFSGRLHNDLTGVVLHDLFFDQSKYGQRERFNATDSAVALTTRTGFLAGFTQRRAQPLS